MAKYAGKYETADELEKAYAELQSKLGEQGKELSETKKQATQLKQWVDQAAPIYDWYAKNESEVKRRWEIAERPQQQAAAPAQAQQQAAAVVANDPATQWLTPEERKGLINDLATHLATTTVNPWTEKFSAAVQKYAQDTEARLQNQYRAMSGVMWQTLQKGLPPDKLAEIQKFHEESLKYADPSKLDPMKMAEDALALRAEVSSWKSKYEEQTKQQEERERAAVPSLGTGSFPASASEQKPMPASKDDRFKAVMEAVKTEHGQDGIHSLFGANR